jgi:hypothetical protein
VRGVSLGYESAISWVATSLLLLQPAGGVALGGEEPGWFESLLVVILYDQLAARPLRASIAPSFSVSYAVSVRTRFSTPPASTILSIAVSFS